MEAKLTSAISWIVANRSTLAILALVLVGAMSALIAALEKLVALLVTVFPSLKTADGELKHIAAWLDALSKASWLNTLALTPAAKPVATAAPAKTGQARLGFLLFLVAAVAGVACSHISTVEQQLIDCGESAVVSSINSPGPSGGPSILTQVQGLLSSGQVNWQTALDSLLSTAGSAVVCAVEVAVTDLEHSSAPKSQVQQVSMIRGEAWLASEGHAKLVKPPAAAKK